MITVAAIVDVLQSDSTISSLCGSRVYDHDLRQSGWEATPAAFDGDGIIQPSLMVDDTGGSRAAFIDGVDIGQVTVWAFGPRTPAGRADVATLTTRTIDVLHRWQDGTTGALLQYAGRLGQQSDNDGTFDRVQFQVTGVLAVTRW